MATESELIDLLSSIGDRAPTAKNIIDRLAPQTAPAASSSSSHRRWLPISAAVAAVAVSVVVSVAMRGAGPDDGAPAGPGTSEPAVDRTTYSLPLDAYHASATQERTLQRAQFVLAQRCARGRGVNVSTARIPAGDPQQAFLTSVAYNVRPLTLQQARTIGYDMYPSGTSAVGAALVGLTPQQLEIFRGWNRNLNLPRPADRFLLDGGCDGQATRTLLEGAAPRPLPSNTRSLNGQPGLFDDDESVYTGYVSQAFSGETSPEVGEAQKRWASCMAARGYSGLHMTQDAIASVGHAGSLRSASAKREAVQDVQCKQSTGFMTVWIASMTKAQNAVIAAHRPQLAEFKQRLATRMANAAKALR